MKYQVEGQLAIFEDTQPKPKPVKKVFYVSAVDNFDRRKEDWIEAYTYKQACWLFKEKHGRYWKPHG